MNLTLLNWILLTSFVLLLVAAIAFIFVKRDRYTLWEKFLYIPVYVLSRLWWHVEIYWAPEWFEDPPTNTGVSASPRKQKGAVLRDRIQGGAVLIANHRSSIDPFFIQLASGARVHWMVAGEYFRHKLFGPILRSYQAIPTQRGGADNGAIKLAIQHAQNGGFVGMFPEGRINRTDDDLLSIRPGAALVADKANVPLIPIWIEGAPTGPEVYSPLFKSARVRVYVGTPMSAPADIAKREMHIQWTEAAMTRVLELGKREQVSISIAGKSWLDS